jgi:hypothetical protein
MLISEDGDAHRSRCYTLTEYPTHRSDDIVPMVIALLALQIYHHRVSLRDIDGDRTNSSGISSKVEEEEEQIEKIEKIEKEKKEKEK